jgi:hypothetical protein
MTDPEPTNEQPKIIIDDDWKEQVAKEKAAAAEHAADAEPSGDDAGQAVSEEKAAAQVSSEELPPPPPASFDVLVSMLFTQALATLGHLPNPATGKAEVNKPYAKHYIDTLEMLEEKTKGNLSDDEKKILADALHTMRMAYVDAKA